uniref:Uncharacterized protein n=1 Tax=Arion vulgaris TaxID=1028688 RepID=A0A0B6ZGT3_9EUPU
MGDPCKSTTHGYTQYTQLKCTRKSYCIDQRLGNKDKTVACKALKNYHNWLGSKKT